MTCHQYGIAAFISQVSFCWETNAGIAKHRLSPRANKALNTNSTNLNLTLNSGKIFLCCNDFMLWWIQYNECLDSSSWDLGLQVSEKNFIIISGKLCNITWHLSAFIGHFEDDDIGLQLPEFIEHFCFLIYICPSRWDLSNNSPNLHQKTTNWTILVLIVKWCHHSMYCPVAIIWGIFPVNTSQLIFNLNFFYYTGLYIIQTNSALHVLNFSFPVFYLESR